MKKPSFQYSSLIITWHLQLEFQVLLRNQVVMSACFNLFMNLDKLNIYNQRTRINNWCFFVKLFCDINFTPDISHYYSCLSFLVFLYQISKYAPQKHCDCFCVVVFHFEELNFNFEKLVSWWYHRLTLKYRPRCLKIADYNMYIFIPNHLMLFA